MTTHRLDAGQHTVTEVFSRELPPVLTVEAGDTVIVHSLPGRGYLQRPAHPGAPTTELLSPRRGHCLVGPIAVRGAKPGMALAVELVALSPDEWGYTEAMAADTTLNRRLKVAGAAPSWLLWSIDVAAGTATSDRGHTLPIAPFLGIIGLPPDEPGEHRTKPPRGCGGNVDCKELVAGSTLFLPVTVPDALVCVGDGHAAQGDGEVGGTAIECGMTSELRLDLVTDPPLPTMHALTPTGRVTFGFSADLEEATAQALAAICDWMSVLYGLDRNEALALAGCAVDLRITQVVNETWGVHAVLPRHLGAPTPPANNERKSRYPMDRRIVNPWTWQDARGFVQAHEVSGATRTLYCAGVTSVDADGVVMHAGDMAAQLLQALDNLETILDAAGYTLADVVRLTTYTTDVDACVAARPPLIRRLTEANCRYASTLLGVERLAQPQLLVELEATAAR